MIRLAVHECDIAKRLLGLIDGERRMTNLLHLVELLHVEASERHLGPSGLLHHLAEMRRRLESPEDSEQIRLESDDDTVTLTTIHKSKGLEYGVVLCPFPFKDFLALNAEKSGVYFHAPDGAHGLCLDLGSERLEQHLELMRDESHAENLRLAYVALTRAKHRTQLYWCAARGYEESALAYLLHGKDARSLLGEPNRAQVATHVRGLPEQALLQRLHDLAQANPCIGVSVADPGAPGSAYPRRIEASKKLQPRTLATPLDGWQRTASFTELAHTTAERLGPNEGRDHDEFGLAFESIEGARGRCLLADFPGGARAGNFFHSVLERWDFTQKLPEPLVREQLAAHGIEPDLAELAQKGLAEVVATPLAESPGGLRLRDLSAASRINELEFLLCASGGATHEASERSVARIDSARVATAFERWPSPELPAEYRDRVRELRFVPLAGFLKGYIDLVFEFEGRYYLADYKSNRLGDRYVDYDALAMQRCMSENHYFLQYHLYSVALHRLLSLRQKGYEYERDFGGVFYLFLRGMQPKRPSGVFFEKPPRERIEALSVLFQNEALA